MDETLNQIVNNEVYMHIKRFPTAQEFHSLIEYITHWEDSDTNLKELAERIKQWVNDYMAECQNCGQWHLKEDMINPYGDDEYYCDDQCWELYKENTYDMREEARAEYNASNR